MLSEMSKSSPSFDEDQAAYYFSISFSILEYLFPNNWSFYRAIIQVLKIENMVLGSRFNG